MNVDLCLLDLRLRRRVLIGTTIGAAAYLAIVVAIWPSFRHDTAFNDLVQGNPAAAALFGITESMATPTGWLSANMYANFGPLLALLLSIGYGANAVAGQDADGLLALVATQPLSRGRVIVTKLVTLLIVAALIPLVSWAVCLAGPRFDLIPRWGALAAVSLTLTLMAFDLGAVALVVGILTGSRGLALGVASGLAAAAYLVSSLAPINDTVHAFRWVSPFYWSIGNGQLASGVSWLEALLLVGLGLVMAWVAYRKMQRYDIR